MEETRRIILLGKTGSGKSSLANTIFGEKVFTINHTVKSETKECQAETRSVHGRSITLIDTPGFFDTDMSEEKLKPEIVRCITECAPGPHAILIVLKLEKFTEQENNVIKEICEYFSEEAFKYAAIVLTHGDQLPEGKEMMESVRQNKHMNDLLKKCGGRCHIVDNKYWNNNQPDEYRRNQFQVKQLLKTIDKMMENNGGCYTNEMLKTVKEEIQQEVKRIRLSSENMSEQKIKEQAKVSVFNKVLIRLAGIATGAALGAFFGVVVVVGIVATVSKDSSKPVSLKQATKKTVLTAGREVLSVMGGAPMGGAPVYALAGVGVVGAVKGGWSGYAAAEGAETPQEAAKRAAAALNNEAQSYLNRANDVWNGLSQPESKQS